MKGKIVNGSYARLEGPARQARRIYLEAWLRWGFTILLLHKRAKDGECCCSHKSRSRQKNRKDYLKAIAEGRIPPCSNPGKHLIDKASKSMATSVNEIEDHLDDGGSIGLALRMEGVPDAPVSFVVFDCDKADAEEWLHARTPRSPLSSRGKVGMHDYQVIADGVPLLRSDTTSLNPGRKHPATLEKPGIDIKVSGLVVMAYSQNKVLFWDGEDISAEPEVVARVFGGSLEDFIAKLPHVDPRSLAPRMREFAPPIAIPGGVTPPPSIPSPGGIKVMQSQSVLSIDRPRKDQVQGILHGVAYHHRRHLADNYLYDAKPAIEGENPDGRMFYICVLLLKHYCLSEQDALQMIKKRVNPRCLDADGEKYPYQDRQLIHMIEGAREVTCDPIGVANLPDFSLDIDQMHSNHRRRDQRSNDRRNKRRLEDRAEEEGYILEFLSECCVVGSLNDYQVNQRDLYDACREWVKVNRWGARISDSRIGRVLRNQGIKQQTQGHDKIPIRLGITFLKEAAG